MTNAAIYWGPPSVPPFGISDSSDRCHHLKPWTGEEGMVVAILFLSSPIFFIDDGRRRGPYNRRSSYHIIVTG